MARFSISGILMGILPPILSANALTIIAYLVVNYSEIGINSNRLMEILPWFFLVNFVLILCLALLNLKSFREQFKGVKKNTWLLLIAIVILGFFMREFLIPHTHRIFFDEDLYSGIGNSIAKEFRAIMCNYGTPEKCGEGILNKDPSGWPFTLAVFYWLFGSAEKIAFIVSVFIGTISIALVFLIVYLLSRNETAGLYASLLFALTPAHLIWSGSIATEVPFAFFSMLTILSYLLYFENESFKTHLLGVTLLAYTVQIRPEGGIFIGVIAIMFLLFEDSRFKKLFTWRFWFPWVLLFVLITPHMMQAYMNREGSWGAPSGEKLGWKYVDANLTKNTLFWYSGEMHPLFFTFLALLGIVYLILREKKNLLFNTVWFSTFFILFIFFYAGSVDNGGIGFRFINLYCAPAAILGGYGAFMIHNLLSKKKLLTEKIVAIIMVALILLSFLFLSDFLYREFVEVHKFVTKNGCEEARKICKPTPGSNQPLNKNQYVFPCNEIIGILCNPHPRYFLTNENQYPPVKGPMNLTFSRTVSFVLTPDKQAQYARDMHDILVMPNMNKIDGDCWILTHNPSVFLVEGRNSLQSWYGSNKKVMDRVFNESDCVMWLQGAWCLFAPHKDGVCKSMHNRYNLTVIDSYTRPENTKQTFTLYRVRRK